MGRTPAEVAAACPLVFGMLADPVAAAEVALGAGGVVEGLRPGGAYVDMSTVDEATSQRIAQGVAATGARFLEAPVSGSSTGWGPRGSACCTHSSSSRLARGSQAPAEQTPLRAFTACAGSRQPAIDGQLIILAAGDASVYEEALPAFEVMGKRSLLLGEVGAGARMKLVVNVSALARELGAAAGCCCWVRHTCVGGHSPPHTQTPRPTAAADGDGQHDERFCRGAGAGGPRLAEPGGAA